MPKTILKSQRKPTKHNRAVPYMEAATILGVGRTVLDEMTANTFSVVRHSDSKRAPKFLMEDELDLYLRINAKYGPGKASDEVRALRKAKGRLKRGH